MTSDRDVDRLLAEAEIAAHMGTIGDHGEEWKAGYMAAAGDALMAMNKMAEQVVFLEREIERVHDAGYRAGMGAATATANEIAQAALTEADGHVANSIQVMRSAELTIERLTAEIGKLVAALDDAEEGMIEMIAYVPEYFVTKWDLTAYIMRVRAAKHRG